MALFNKLFPGLKTISQNCHEVNNVSQKASPFSVEHVRVVLFRECDFRGRKLLFDSDATEKIPVEKAEQDKKFVEVNKGYGYLVNSKQNSEYPQLSEMIFGSVAMSFRGTYFKIHSLNAPTRLMFTQVFPSPYSKRNKSSSTSSYQSHVSTQSFEHSIKLDDSGASSNFSTSDRLSDRSTASDTVLVCRRLQSNPLDVPGFTSSISKNSVVVDSGCTDQSFSSTSTGPLTFPTWESFFPHKGIFTTSLSSCSVFKRLLRSSTRALQTSSISLPNSTEVLLKGHHRTSKLGLCIIVEIPSEKQQFWATENPHWMRWQHTRYQQKINLCAGITGQRIIDPFFIEDNLAGDRYLQLLRDQIVPALVVLFPDPHNVGVPHNVVYKTKPNCLEDLKQRIEHECRRIEGIDILQNVLNVFPQYFAYCQEVNGRFFTQLFMEHIALLEALIWRTRQAIEVAYHRPATFISLMMDIAQSIATWLVNLLNAPRTVINLWHCLCFGCDNYNSINAFVCELDNKSLDLRRTYRSKSSWDLSGSDTSDKLGFSKSFSGLPFRNRTDVFNFNFSKFLKTDWGKISKRNFNEGELVVDQFLREFCELLEEFDVKDTNFFMSTLLTAVLTHHLGWVATVFSSSAVDTEAICNFRQPYNALWEQLADLYGAVGHPVKTAQTVITGNNKNNIVSKILNSLTYFIRFGHFERKHVERCCVEGENKSAAIICMKNNCIPNEHYKRYEDHLKEILTVESPKPCCSKVVNGDSKNRCKSGEKNIQSCPNVGIAESDPKAVNMDLKRQLKPSNGLSKIKTHDDLSKLVLKESPEHSIEHPKRIGLSRVPSTLEVLKTSLISVSDFSNGCDENQNNFSKSYDLNRKILPKTSNITDFTKLEAKTDLEKESDSKVDEDMAEISCDKSSVVFVLGDSDKLVGLKREEQYASTHSKESHDTSIILGVRKKGSLAKRPSSLNLSKISYEFSKIPAEVKYPMQNSTSYESLCLENKGLNVTNSKREPHLNVRAHSEPPELGKISPTKYQYSRVKFNLQQYPQVVRNYMKSKNIELEGLSLGEKAFEKFATVQHNIKLDFSGYENDLEEVEVLQTPSNASELEFTSDMCVKPQDSKEASPLRRASKVDNMSRQMMLINIPMPKTTVSNNPEYSIPYTATVIKGLVDSYIPDMVLQGVTNPKTLWDSKLKSNLAMNTQHSLLDQPVEESLAIVANTDTWEIQVMSSHTYVIDKGTNGVRVGMSQLVANMLESLLQMWKLHIPPQYCILHIEQRLQELCVRSKALAQMLLASEFCSMELLTSSLRIEVNDVPLLMAVAATHTPEVTLKYGLSFQ